MAATKIINVARDDRFDEILDLFRQTAAEEVIFVLPKNAKAFNREANVAALRNAAHESGKRISLLCPNPRVVALASAYGFDILPDRSSHTPGKKAKARLAADAPDDEMLDLVQDDSDAFEEDVRVPSDESVRLNGTGKDDLGGMHEEEGERELGDVPPEDAEQLEQEPPEEELMSEEALADEIRASERPTSASLASAVVRRRLDGVAYTHDRSKSVAPKVVQERSDRVSVHRGAASRRMDDIAKVWQSERPNAGMWADIPHERPVSRFAALRLNRRLRLGIIGTLVAIAGIGSLIFFTTGSAQVVITPAGQELALTIHATISDTISEVDPVLKRIPGQVFSVEKTVSQEFSASGEKDVAQKARGKVTVLNGLSSAQPLVATTRFESPTGLVFRSLRSISVSAATTRSGVATPGSAEVEIIADKVGSEYNIAATIFVIPAFREKGDAERYQKVTAKSDTSFSGGVNGKAKVVTEVDYQKARDAVSERAKLDVSQALKAEIGSLVMPEKLEVIVKSVSSNVQVDQAADSFVVSGTGAVKTVGVRKEDMQSLVSGIVEREKHLTVLPDRLTITLNNGQFSETSGAYEADILVSGTGYAVIDKDKIIADLAGKNELDIRSYLKSAEGVASARVTLSPFWVAKVPENKSKISLQLKYE